METINLQKFHGGGGKWVSGEESQKMTYSSHFYIVCGLFESCLIWSKGRPKALCF